MSLSTTNPPQPTGYMLLFRSTNWSENLPQGEVHQMLAKVNTWFDGLSTSGKLIGAQPLMDDSVRISGPGGRTVIDGPFAEAKEVIGGYVLLSAESMEEAVTIAKTNPMHDYGLTTEVRVTASTCPHIYQALNRASRIEAEAVAIAG